MSEVSCSQAIETDGPLDMLRRFLLWIDGVGAFLVCMSDQVSIGGPVSEGPVADISLLANLSRKHATVVRGGEGYVLNAHAATTIEGRDVDQQCCLNDGNEIGLGGGGGGGVKLRFRLPTVLSGTARLELLSDHRPVHTVDAVVLMDDTCILGAGAESHVCCPNWPESVLLFRHGSQLLCKSRSDIFINGQHTTGDVLLHDGAIVTGVDCRFRIEAIGGSTTGPLPAN